MMTKKKYDENIKGGDAGTKKKNTYLKKVYWDFCLLQSPRCGNFQIFSFCILV